MTTISLKNRIVDNLYIFVIILSSITGLTLVDFIGMNVFWGVFILTSLIICYLILKKVSFKWMVKSFLEEKFNIILIVYLAWMALSYLVNYQGKSTLLYIFKMYFILIIYLCMFYVYLKDLDESYKNGLIYRLCKYTFILGCVHTFLGVYQYITRSNNFLGFILTTWPAYNPASMYGNVNGLGTFLFLSIIAGFYCLIYNGNGKYKNLIIFLLIAQLYMIYLTIARTSIICVIVYIILNLVFILISKREYLKLLINKRTIIVILFTNLLMSTIIQMPNFNINFGVKPTTERKTSDMLAEKNSKGFNQRQFIWKAVIKDSKEYMLFGDGLKYDIVNKINVEDVISSKSKGVTRISYHNTLFRYFASNGLIGLIIFLITYAYVPLALLIKMFRERKFNIKYANLITLFFSIFLYMQMEEVYLGEIGFIQLVTLTLIAYSISYTKKLDNNISR